MKTGEVWVVGTYHLDIDGSERLAALLETERPGKVAVEYNSSMDGLAIEARKKREAFWTSPDKARDSLNARLREWDLQLSPTQMDTLIAVERKVQDQMGFEVYATKDYNERHPETRIDYIDTALFNGGMEKEQFVPALQKNFLDSWEAMVQSPEFRQHFVHDILSDGIQNAMEFQRKQARFIYQNADAFEEMFEELNEVFADPEAAEELAKELPPEQLQAVKQMINPERDAAMAHEIRKLHHLEPKSGLVAVVGLAHMPGIVRRVDDLNPVALPLGNYSNGLGSL